MIPRARSLKAVSIGIGLILAAIPVDPTFAENSEPEAELQDSAPSRADVVDRIFARMTEVLPGRWQGEFADGTADNPTSEWTGTIVEYEITAGGTALMENYVDASGNPYMTTVYHKDNNDLRATHFCGARNHPRMIARKIDTKSDVVVFDFVDVANLKTVESYHSRGLSLEIGSDNSIVLTFKGLEEGKGNSRVFRFRKDPT